MDSTFVSYALIVWFHVVIIASDDNIARTTLVKTSESFRVSTRTTAPGLRIAF